MNMVTTRRVMTGFAMHSWLIVLIASVTILLFPFQGDLLLIGLFFTPACHDSTQTNKVRAALCRAFSSTAESLERRNYQDIDDCRLLRVLPVS